MTETSIYSEYSLSLIFKDTVTYVPRGKCPCLKGICGNREVLLYAHPGLIYIIIELREDEEEREDEKGRGRRIENMRRREGQ